MIEFDETLTKRYVGKTALIQKIESILKLSVTDIPYYPVGIDATLFQYSSPAESIESALRKFNAVVETSGEGTSRVIVADVSIDVTDLMTED